MNVSGAIITAVGTVFNNGDIGCLISNNEDHFRSGEGLAAGAKLAGVTFLYFCERSRSASDFGFL